MRSDLTAVVELAAFRPGRILGDLVGTLLVYPSKTPSTVYERIPLMDGGNRASQSQPASSEDFSKQFLDELNAVRSQAGLRAVGIDPAQSAFARKVAPHYFAAQLGTTSVRVSGEIALGMMAGWEINGAVREGHFVSHWVSGASEPSRLLEGFLSFPAGRRTLLARSIQQCALGVISDSSPRTLAAVVGAYVMVDEVPPEILEEQVVRDLNAARAAAKMPRAVWVPSPREASASVAAQVHAGELEPLDALNDLMRIVSQGHRVGVRGWVMEAFSLEKLTYPQELLQRTADRVTVVVTSHKPLGQPWSRYVVFFLVTDADGLRIASASPRQSAVWTRLARS